MNRKIKFLAVGAAVAATVGLGAGLVTAQTGDPPAPAPTTCPMHTADMDEMHSQMSQQMQGKHSGTHEHMSEMGGMNMHGMP